MAEIKKLDLTSASGASINLEALYQICPQCFTEVRDEETGQIERKINFTTLRELLGDNAYENADEEYGFNWVGKRAAQREAGRPINKTLRPCPEESEDWDHTQNLYIEGDNLDVLKLLQKSYLGAIKMIYIDPPYNTGNDFVYRDDFAMRSDEYDLEAGNTDKLGNRFRRNSDSNLRFHSDWCSMISERLSIARTLLSNDGVIFISIDDHEIQNLKLICNNLFGEDNFVACVVWQKKYAATNDAKGFSTMHDYIVVYRKSENFQRNLLPRTDEQNQPYKYDDHDGKGLWRSDNLLVKSFSESGVYPIVNPNTGKEYYPPQGSCWRASQETMLQWLHENRIFFGKDGKGAPQLKRYLNEVQQGRVPITWWTFNEVGHNDEANKEMSSLFERKTPFDTPKPTRLIRHMLRIGSNKDSLVLDFFSGSATTAHAVMQLNADDGGNRKFIMVQLPEPTPENSEAHKAGYANICEIGKERIRRAGKKIKKEHPKAKDLDTGFRVLKLDESNLRDVYFTPAAIQQQDLFAQVENVKEGRTHPDLLFGCMLSWGMELTLPLADFEVNGKKVFNVNDGELVACFEHDINEDIINAIADLNPLRVVFRDNGFNAAPLKINLFEMFKQRCGWTEEMVSDRVKII